MPEENQPLPAAVASPQPCDDALIREYLDVSMESALKEFEVQSPIDPSRGGAAFIVGSPETAYYTAYMGISREDRGDK